MPLSKGLVGFVELRCYAEECAFSLSTQAQNHVWDLAECKRVESAQCLTEATSGRRGCEQNLLWAYHPFLFAHAPCLLHKLMTVPIPLVVLHSHQARFRLYLYGAPSPVKIVCRGPEIIITII